MMRVGCVSLREHELMPAQTVRPPEQPSEEIDRWREDNDFTGGRSVLVRRHFFECPYFAGISSTMSRLNLIVPSACRLNTATQLPVSEPALFVAGLVNVKV